MPSTETWIASLVVWMAIYITFKMVSGDYLMGFMAGVIAMLVNRLIMGD